MCGHPPTVDRWICRRQIFRKLWQNKNHIRANINQSYMSSKIVAMCGGPSVHSCNAYCLELYGAKILCEISKIVIAKVWHKFYFCARRMFLANQFAWEQLAICGHTSGFAKSIASGNLVVLLSGKNTNKQILVQNKISKNHPRVQPTNDFLYCELWY